jgi:hypothetical protein
VVYSSSLELYIASGGSGIDIEEGGPSAGKGSGDCEGSGDSETRVSIVMMNLRLASIKCRLKCSASKCERDARSFWYCRFGGVRRLVSLFSDTVVSVVESRLVSSKSTP